MVHPSCVRSPQLANLRNLYPSHVRTLVLDVEPTANRLCFLYKVKHGVAAKRSYMTDFLAQIAGVPPSVCSTAKRLSQTIDFDPVDRRAPCGMKHAAAPQLRAHEDIQMSTQSERTQGAHESCSDTHRAWLVMPLPSPTQALGAHSHDRGTCVGR